MGRWDHVRVCVERREYFRGVGYVLARGADILFLRQNAASRDVTVQHQPATTETLFSLQQRHFSTSATSFLVLNKLTPGNDPSDPQCPILPIQSRATTAEPPVPPLLIHELIHHLPPHQRRIGKVSHPPAWQINHRDRQCLNIAPSGTANCQLISPVQACF
jgi:hypothetical protein